MKRLILNVILICITTIAHSQVNRHMTFKDIDINGSTTQFTTKLKAKGYKSTTEASTLLSGEFAGYTCKVAVYGTAKTDVTYQIIVVFDTKGDSWYSVKGQYNKLKELYTSKYGKPSDSAEWFLSPYYEGDGYELSAIRNNKAFFFTKWELSEGNINIMISKDNILVSYSDNANKTLNDQEERNKSLNDI